MSNEQTAPSESSLQGQYAGFVTRLSAILIDMALVIVALFVVILVFRLILQFFNLDALFAGLLTNLTARHSSIDTLVRLLAAAGTFYFIFFLYYITLHAVSGGLTIGKALMGARVVRMDGTPLSFGRCTRRYLTFILSALPLFLGLLWVIWDDRRQGWHDKLSGTCVIYDWPAQEDESFLSGVKNRLQYASATRGRGDGSVSENKSDEQPAAAAASESPT